MRRKGGSPASVRRRSLQVLSAGGGEEELLCRRNKRLHTQLDLPPQAHHEMTRGTRRLKPEINQVHPFMVTVFPDGSGLFQQDNESCHTAQASRRTAGKNCQPIVEQEAGFRPKTGAIKNSRSSLAASPPVENRKEAERGSAELKK
ncbi:hypothetical protein AOLI_G00104710 [Acnodon oligacanthus]